MRVHLIAIGGAVMHNLALALKGQGHEVSGSDDRIVDPSRGRLESAGLLPDSTGWDASRITNEMDLVIVGMHARRDNPEIRRAQSLGIKLLSYPHFIYESCRGKQRVVVGGSHGKTTTTSILLSVAQAAGREFDYLVGAQLKDFDTMVRLDPHSPLAILEGDEYPSSPLDPQPKFHVYRPHIGVLTGIHWDHANVFATPESYLRQFELYVDIIGKEEGILVYNEEDSSVTELVDSRNDVNKVAYRRHPSVREGTTWKLKRPDGSLTAVPLFGRHNMSNIGAARAVADLLGIEEEFFYGALESFEGADRRLQLVAESGSAAIFWDFAHAPSKVRASVSALLETYSGRRLIACLELHTFSSLTASFQRRYAGVLQGADRRIVYFDPAVVAAKKLDSLSEGQVREAFDDPDLEVLSNAGELHELLFSLDLDRSNLLLMTSGSMAGVELETLASKLLDRPGDRDSAV